MTDKSHSSTAVAAASDDCPLPARVQQRNICCFAAFWAIVYLCAPVSYVGLTHANLLKALGNGDTVSNLPSAVFLWMTIVPVVAAWFFSDPHYLKPLALIAIGANAAITAAVASTLWVGASPRLVTAVVIGHAAVFGVAGGVLVTALWDILRRSVSSSRRGPALGFAFGIGPLFACVGALLQDAVFDGRLLGGRTFGLEFPTTTWRCSPPSRRCCSWKASSYSCLPCRSHPSLHRSRNTH